MPSIRSLALVVVMLAGVACSPAPASDAITGPAGLQTITPSPKATPANPEFRELSEFKRRRAMDHVRALAADIGVRVRATEGERRGATYIKRELEALGYEVFVQKFSVDGRRSRNVVAKWPGARRYPIVIGAHMDSVPTSPGANDNASGVAVMLEIARIARDTRHAQFLKFIAFGAEEYGTDGTHHVGSQVYVNRLGDKGRRRLGGMVSVDMVADGRPLLIGTSGIGPEVLARHVYKRADRANIRVRYITTCDCSDNGPFERAGIPASFMWSGPESNYHDDSDTAPNMVPRDLERTGKAVRAFVRSVRQELLERLRRY